MTILNRALNLTGKIALGTSISATVALSTIHATAYGLKGLSNLTAWTSDGIYSAENYVFKYLRNKKDELKHGIATSYGYEITDEALSDEDKILMTRSEADAIGLDAALFLAIVSVESHGDEEALSEAGCIGLAQINPSNVKFCGYKSSKKLVKTKNNLRCGAKLLKYLLDKNRGDIHLSVAQYNAGESRAKTLQKLPKETQKYIPLVMAQYRIIKNQMSKGV